MTKEPSRRSLLRAAGSIVGLAASELGAPARAAERSFVCIVLRGGADGLSLVIPHTDPSYYRARPRTAIAPPGLGAERAREVSADLALHPQLAPLLPLYRARELALVVGAGLPGGCRRHSTAQSALVTALAEVAGEPLQQAPGDSLADQLAGVARSLREGTRGPHLAFCEGWDTHVAQGAGESGRLAARVAELARDLVTFRRLLADRLQSVTVAVVTEFGRSVSETPMGGTDDGGASVALLLADFSSAPQMIGHWSDLTEEARIERRFAPVTTDLRVPLAAALRGARGTA